MTDPAPFFPMQLAPADPPPDPPPPPRPLVLVAGDSFTTGYAGLGEGPRNWTRLVSDRLGVELVNDAVGGSGYVPTINESTFPYAISGSGLAGQVEGVVIFGGFNDRAHPPAALRIAAAVALRLARLLYPQAARLVVGPQFPSGNVPPEMWALRDAVRSAAEREGARFADPLAEGWFAEPDRYIWSVDAIHPTDAGHQHLADRIAPRVAELLKLR